VERTRSDVPRKLGRVRLCAPSITFSRTLIEANRPRFWNVRAMPSAEISCGEHASRSCPSKTMPPDSGS
jgi:hypothetical protein